ncbi:MAG: response regulator, partial [Bacteroidota bacterium]
MLRTILIDDQKKSRRVLEELLRTYFPQVEIIAMAESAEEGLKFIKELKPALIFLDIEMPYQSGFDMLQQCEQIDFDIIFVTAHDQYAIKAFKFSALDYLLKPVDIEELRNA